MDRIFNAPHTYVLKRFKHNNISTNQDRFKSFLCCTGNKHLIIKRFTCERNLNYFLNNYYCIVQFKMPRWKPQYVGNKVKQTLKKLYE